MTLQQAQRGGSSHCLRLTDVSFPRFPAFFFSSAACWSAMPLLSSCSVYTAPYRTWICSVICRVPLLHLGMSSLCQSALMCCFSGVADFRRGETPCSPCWQVVLLMALTLYKFLSTTCNDTVSLSIFYIILFRGGQLTFPLQISFISFFHKWTFHADGVTTRPR